MPDADKLTPADPSDRPTSRCSRLRAAIPGPQTVHNADEIMAEIVAKRLVEHLERGGYRGVVV